MKWTLGLVGLLSLALAGALAWRYLDAGGLQRLTAPLRSTAASAAGVLPVAGGSGLRKCLLDGKPVYTNEACPSGSREQAMSGGSLSVLPAAPVPRSADAESVAPVGNARDLLLKPGKPGEPDLKAKRIDAIVNQ